jgi:hypothetical protein
LRNRFRDGQTFYGLFLPNAPNSQLPLGATFSAQDFMSHIPAIEARTQTDAGLETTLIEPVVFQEHLASAKPHLPLEKEQGAFVSKKS